MWTAKITDKSLSEGRLSVTYELSDGENKYGERIEISNAQDVDWLKNHINNRIKVFDSLSKYAKDIQVGEVDLTVEAKDTGVTIPQIDTEEIV